jgi:lysophospholipase L1-like esterase
MSTIQLLHPFNGRSPGLYDLGVVENERLVSIGLARDYTAGMDGENPIFSPTEMAAVKSLYSDGKLESAETPQRVFILGDSISARQYQTIVGLTVSVSGASITFTSASVGVPIGASIRVTNQVAIYNEVGIVTASSASGFTAVYSKDLTGLISGTCNVFFYSRTNDTGWINYAAGLLAAQGKPLSIVRNCAVGGAKVAEMLVRMNKEIVPIAQPGDILMFMGGINDVEVTDTSVTDAPNAIATIASIFDEALSVGLTVHASTITPAQASGYFSVAATGLAQIAAINGYIKARCSSEARARCFDSWAATQSGGSYAAAGMMETGGVHPLPAGAQVIGARYVTDCGIDVRKGRFRRWASDADNYLDAASWNLLTNAQFNGATGSTAPTGWTISGSANTLALSDNATTGKDLSITKAHTAGNATTLYQDITTRVTAGDRLIFGTEYETVTIGQGHYFLCDLVITVAGIEMIYGIARNQFTVANGSGLPAAGSRYFFELASGNSDGREGCLVPAGFTSVLFRYTLRQDSAGSCAIKVARPHVYKVGRSLV